jgi:hypothetical protein
MKEFIKNKLGVPENWDKYDYQLARYSFEDIEEVLLAYEQDQLRLGVVSQQSELLRFMDFYDKLNKQKQYEGLNEDIVDIYLNKP